MSQFALPFDEPPTPLGAANGLAVIGGSEDDVQSSEENEVEAVTFAVGRLNPPPPQRLTRRDPRRGSSPVAAWPAALTWPAALDYTSLSTTELRRWERAGALRFRRIGRHGARVVMRTELDNLLEQIFGSPFTDIAEDFDFG